MKEVDFINFVDIVVSAYPGRRDGLEPTREQLKHFLCTIKTMRLHDFEMNLFSKEAINGEMKFLNVITMMWK
ncbi:hypothetical protein [Lysinibacillus xylanilyticus]|uniref:hypothetical protein n=1 Tax=Lysinibacillus xylanilyticus TaxID=582475 RepID=UPI003D044225